MTLSVLVTDDDAWVRRTIQEALEGAGHTVRVASDGEEAIALCSHYAFDVVISDVRMPRMSGRQLFERLRQTSPSTAVILVTGHGSIVEAVDCLKAGIEDYITKPFDMGELLIRVERVGDRVRLQHELATARVLLGHEAPKIIGRSPLMRALVDRIQMAAASDVSIVIHGEGGTGKQLVARLVHEGGRRSRGPFVVVNCSALAEGAIEAELFGDPREVTARSLRHGDPFRAAQGGTLLLEDVDEVQLKDQITLLRVLQDRMLLPALGTPPVPFDARVICSTRRNLKQLVRSGRFREDLFYALNVLELHVPALRDRRPDLPHLAMHLHSKLAPEGGHLEMTPRAWAALMHHSFPGNVRELQNAIQHAIVLSGGQAIDVDHLPADVVGSQASGSAGAAPFTSLAQSVREFERQCLIAALNAANGTKVKTAQLLGISRKTLWEKLKLHQIGDADLAEDEDAAAASERIAV